ncbi:hypothetical protein SESBI_37024 [Sesbania bispinosa]|nr:hypothetical protein SESBI_37024 [Sesbania bispinosa]
MDNLSAPSPEEEDLCDRSIKKVKFDPGTDVNMEIPSNKDQPPPPSPMKRVSYKDKVTASEMIEVDPEDMVRAVTDDLFSEALDCDDEDDNSQPLELTNNPLSSSCFGPWMLAKKPQRRVTKAGNTSLNREGRNLGSRNNGSRFEVLQSETATHEDPVENSQPSSSIPLKQPPMTIKGTQSSKGKNVKKDPIKNPGTGTSKQNSVRAKPVITPKTKLSQAIPEEQMTNPIDQELQNEKRQKEQEMLELMRRHRARLKEQYLNGGTIVDILGGSSNASFWDPPNFNPSVPVHPLAPDIKEPTIDAQSEFIQQDQDSHMEDESSTLQTKLV